jgi:hypothetical protein
VPLLRIANTYFTATGFLIPSFPRKRESSVLEIPEMPTLGLDVGGRGHDNIEAMISVHETICHDCE